MTRLGQAIAVRRHSEAQLLRRLQKFKTDAPAGHVLFGPNREHRMRQLMNGAEVTDAEAVLLGQALDFPPAFFQREIEPHKSVEIAHVFICGNKRPPRCRCGAVATLLCDAPGQSRGTCDKAMCKTCAVEVGDEHHCPDHARVAP